MAAIFIAFLLVVLVAGLICGFYLWQKLKPEAVDELRKQLDDLKEGSVHNLWEEVKEIKEELTKLALDRRELEKQLDLLHNLIGSYGARLNELRARTQPEEKAGGDGEEKKEGKGHE